MIREATRADLPRLVEMGQRFLSEVEPYRTRMVGNPDQMSETAARLIDQDTGGVFVSTRDDKVIGMIGLLLFPHHLSGELIAGEVFWWVEPEYRGVGVRLVARAERWARDVGAVRVQMIAPAPEIGALYERMGYSPIEVAYERTL